MNPALLVVVFGLLSAASWGVADFSGGLASRRSTALAVVLFSQPVGGLIFLALALARGETSLPQADLVWSVLAGATGPTALVFFYRGLATGRMGVVAPIAGVIGAAVPVVVGGFLEGAPETAQAAGIALGLASVLLVTWSARGSGAGFTGISDAILAGVGFGLFFVFLGQVQGGGAFAPLVVARLVAALVIVGVVILTRASWRLSRASLAPAVISGVLDASGNLWYLLASQQGRLDVAAVLASLYPVVTVLLAAGMLHERIGRVQALGIAAAIGAIVLIAA